MRHRTAEPAKGDPAPEDTSPLAALDLTGSTGRAVTAPRRGGGHYAVAGDEAHHRVSDRANDPDELVAERTIEGDAEVSGDDMGVRATHGGRRDVDEGVRGRDELRVRRVDERVLVGSGDVNVLHD